MTDYERKQEKLDQLRSDMLLEQKCREDFDYCLEYHLDNQEIYNALAVIDTALNVMRIHGWDLTVEELMNEIL